MILHYLQSCVNKNTVSVYNRYDTYSHALIIHLTIIIYEDLWPAFLKPNNFTALTVTEATVAEEISI